MAIRCNAEERKLIAEAYLFHKSVRAAARNVGWSKTTVHRSIRKLIEDKSFRDTYALTELIEKNRRGKNKKR